MQLRPFRNTDTPGLAAIWATQPHSHGVATCATPQMLEAFVLSKPYFDREGMIVAEDDGHLMGFVHAGFGPNERQTDIDTQIGVTCLLFVAQKLADSDLPLQLLEASEAYLKSKGAKLLYAGGIHPINPFYLGFYGGSELPGVMASDEVAARTYMAAGYEVIDQVHIMEADANSFRPPVDRQQLQNRRKFRVDMEPQSKPATWWEACTNPPSDIAKFIVFPADGGPPCGSVEFWIIEPLSTVYNRPTAGLIRLQIDETHQRKGLATFLNSEAMRQLQMGGVTHFEVQTMHSNEAAVALYNKLGFRELDHGLVMRKAV